MTLYAPDGTVAEARTEAHWPPDFMRMLATFALASAEPSFALGIICLHCHQPLQGQNARDDNFWRMDCACRTYIGRNPLSSGERKGH